MGFYYDAQKMGVSEEEVKRLEEEHRHILEDPSNNFFLEIGHWKRQPIRLQNLCITIPFFRQRYKEGLRNQEILRVNEEDDTFSVIQNRLNYWSTDLPFPYAYLEEKSEFFAGAKQALKTLILAHEYEMGRDYEILCERGLRWQMKNNESRRDKAFDEIWINIIGGHYDGSGNLVEKLKDAVCSKFHRRGLKKCTILKPEKYVKGKSESETRFILKASLPAHPNEVLKEAINYFKTERSFKNSFLLKYPLQFLYNLVPWERVDSFYIEEIINQKLVSDSSIREILFNKNLLFKLASVKTMINNQLPWLTDPRKQQNWIMKMKKRPKTAKRLQKSN